MIASEKALFLLGLLNEVGGLHESELPRELGWSLDMIDEAVELLTRYGFITDSARLFVTDSGERLLQSVGLLPNPKHPPIGTGLALLALVSIGVGITLKFAKSSRVSTLIGLVSGVTAAIVSSRSHRPSVDGPSLAGAMGGRTSEGRAPQPYFTSKRRVRQPYVAG